jgi:hypothetical protein
MGGQYNPALIVQQILYCWEGHPNPPVVGDILEFVQWNIEIASEKNRTPFL